MYFLSNDIVDSIPVVQVCGMRRKAYRVDRRFPLPVDIETYCIAIAIRGLDVLVFVVFVVDFGRLCEHKLGRRAKRGVHISHAFRFCSQREPGAQIRLVMDHPANAYRAAETCCASN